VQQLLILNRNKIILLSLVIFLFSCTSLKTNQEVANDYFTLGNEYYSIKNYAKASESFQKVLKYDQYSKEAIINLILSLQKERKYLDSEKIILKYYKEKTDKFDQKLLLLLGNNYFFLDNFTKAQKTFLLYSETFPDDPQGFFNIGLTSMKLSDESNALTYYLKSYQIDKKFTPTLFNLAEYYFKKKDSTNSFIYYKALTELDKDNPEVFFKLGTLEYEIEEYSIAKDHLSRAIELDPKNNDYLIGLAKVYAKGYNNKDKTLETLEKVLMNGLSDINLITSQKEFLLLKEFNEFNELLKKYQKLTINTSSSSGSSSSAEKNLDINKKPEPPKDIKPNKEPLQKNR